MLCNGIYNFTSPLGYLALERLSREVVSDWAHIKLGAEAGASDEQSNSLRAPRQPRLLSPSSPPSASRAAHTPSQNPAPTPPTPSPGPLAGTPPKLFLADAYVSEAADGSYQVALPLGPASDTTAALPQFGKGADFVIHDDDVLLDDNLPAAARGYQELVQSAQQQQAQARLFKWLSTANQAGSIVMTVGTFFLVQ
jgi:hypothetical protein